MKFLEHAGIALATSIVSWVGTIIYITLLIKTGKISKPNFSFKEEVNLISVGFYGLKIILISCLMILSMKLAQFLLETNNLNETLLLIIICIFGFFMYILVTKIFKYIPKELDHFISSKFKKAK